MKQVQINNQDYYISQLNKAKTQGKISNWKISKVKRNRSNVYVQKDYKIESILKAKREESEITIYKEYEDQIGESSFVIPESEDNSKFDLELEDAIFICSQSKSKKFHLPNSKDISVKDSHIDYSIFSDSKFISEFEKGGISIFVAQQLNLLKNVIENSEDKEMKIKLNSFEFHNSIIETSIQTSNEINKSYKKTVSYMEFVLTAIDNNTKKETEHVVYEKINNLYDYDFKSYFIKSIEFVKDTIKAKNSENFNGAIILSDHAVKDFFAPDLGPNPLVAHSLGRLKFYKMSNFEPNKEILKANLDKITLYSNPLVKNNVSSTPYDDDGVSARRTCLIKDNIFQNYFASKKFADYLNLNPSGPLGTIEIEGGSKCENEFYNQELIEIITFASFVPDSISGDFSAEIRLGYKIKDGIKTPFKGGLFTGNIFKLLEDVELSKEVVEKAEYIGPEKIKFHKGEIVGL